jgi:hypothetical protein
MLFLNRWVSSIFARKAIDEVQAQGIALNNQYPEKTMSRCVIDNFVLPGLSPCSSVGLTLTR